MQTTQDIVIVGGGPGGYSAALYAAERGLRATLVSPLGELGGVCLHAGCIPMKHLVRSARAMEETRGALPSLGVYGVAVDEFCGVDLQVVQTRRAAICTRLKNGIRQALEARGVQCVDDRAERVETGMVTTARGQRVSAKNILLAWGTREREALGDLPLAANGVVSPRVLLDAEDVPSSILLIGGGVVGVELASAYRSFGADVTVVECAERLLPGGTDAGVSQALEKSFRARGIKVYTRHRVVQLAPNVVEAVGPDGVAIRLAAECMVNCTGRVARPLLAGLAECGVLCDEAGFVRVDAQGRTSAQGIWSCGDMTGQFQLAHVARAQGRAVVAAIAGDAAARFPGTQRVVSVIDTIPQIAQIGYTAEMLRATGVECREKTIPMGFSGRYAVDALDEGGFATFVVDDANRVRGVHCFGGACGEFIGVMSALMGRPEGAPQLDELRSLLLPHPTQAEILNML